MYAGLILEENDDIKKIFINWWKPKIGDLYCDVDAYGIENISCITTNEKLEIIKTDKYLNYYIPLFNASQLKQFIMDSGYTTIITDMTKFQCLIKISNFFNKIVISDDTEIKALWRISKEIVNSN